MVVVGVIVGELYGNVEVGVSFHGIVYARLHFCPVFAFLVLRQQAGKCVLLVRSQRAGIHVGLIVQLFQDFLHSFPAGFGHAAASVNHTVDGSYGYIGHLGDIFYSDSFHLYIYDLTIYDLQCTIDVALATILQCNFNCRSSHRTPCCARTQ